MAFVGSSSTAAVVLGLIVGFVQTTVAGVFVARGQRVYIPLSWRSESRSADLLLLALSAMFTIACAVVLLWRTV